MAKLLIIVDYQVDFVSGALGFDGAEKLDAPICQRIEEYLSAGDYIAFTFDTHHSNYLETQEGRNLPAPHCISETEGHKLFGRVAGYLDKGISFYKPSFGSGALFNYLLDHPFDSIELCGLVSHICVLTNALVCKTAQSETPIIVDATLTDSFDKSMHEKALDILEGVQVQVLNRVK